MGGEVETGGACLDANVAVAFATGKLKGRELSAVELHVDQCSLCRKQLSHVAELALSTNEEGSSAISYASRATAPLTYLTQGAVVGRYVIERRVGSGGMGVVYAARDPQLRRQVALKALRVDRFGADPMAQEILCREAMAMARMAHPNVVAVYDLFTTEGTVFLAMEYVDSCTLREWLHRAPRSTSDIVHVLAQAGRGLVAAHDEGVVHRDFKPENVLYGVQGRVCVTDFGLARVTERTDLAAASPRTSGVTVTGAVGTPRYMAPEQRAGDRATALSDQYAFCLVLHEALYGELPAIESSGRPRELPPSTGGRRVPRHIRRVLARGLEREPMRRYPAVKHLVADLTRDTRVRWRTWAVAAMGTASIAGAVVITHQRSAAAAAVVCRGSEAKLVGVWDDARRAEVERATLATDKPFAADAWRGVREALDAYGQRWVAARTDACEATRLRGDQSEQMLDMRMACLDDRKAELSALVDVLAQTDQDTVVHAADAARELPAIEPCADTRVLTKQSALEGDSAQAVSAKARLAQVGAFTLAGRYAEALSLASALASNLSEGPRWWYADALVRQGKLLSRLGRRRESEEMLRRAARTADSAGNDRVRVRALGDLAVLVSQQSARSGELPALREEALSALDRSAGTADESELLRSLTIMANYTRQFEDARHFIARAMDRDSRLYGEDSRQVGLDLQCLAAALPEGDVRSLDVGRRALAIQEHTLGPDHPSLIDTETNLGCELVDQARPSEAEPYLRRAVATAEANLGAGSPAVANLLNNLGESLSDKGQNEEALGLHRRALALVEAAGDDESPDLFDSLAGVGRALSGMRAPREALPFLERAARAPPASIESKTATAEVKLLLAQALDALTIDRPRAHKLAREAVDTYRAASPLGPRDQSRLAEAESSFGRGVPSGAVR